MSTITIKSTSTSTIMNFGVSVFQVFLLLFLVEFAVAEQNIQALKTGWLIRSSADVTAEGEKISMPGFDARGWYATNVPTTVLSALQKNGVYRDLYYGRNLETVSPDPFRVSWWYRKEFDLDAATARTQTVRLIFDGINYSANIFVNGTKVGSDDEILGAFRRFDVDISKLVRRKGNVVAVQVFPPKPGDFTIGFVDWNPVPPDRNMGLWRGVEVRSSGPVSIEHPYVQTKLDLQSFKEARLTISATLVNHSNVAVSGKISGTLEGGVSFAQKYSLDANETREIQFTPEEFSALVIQNPRVWWPNNWGSPELYNLKFSIRDSLGVSDVCNVTFGIREVADYLNEQGHRGYMVNGKKILIRGGGWVDDLLLDEDEKKLEAQVQYVKHLNLNTIRMEGFWGSTDKIYELADRYGLLLMVGWSCQWEWTHYLGKEADEPYGGIKTEDDMKLVGQYLQDQVLWLRNHPSIFVWVVGSDMLPPPEMEKRYRAQLSVLDPIRPMLTSCKAWTSEVSGPSAVKMYGPYEYVTPNYWYVDTKNGGAYGFNTETGPGAQPPPEESIRRMFSKEHYWPIDDTWNFHCGRNEFKNMDMYMNAFNKRYGKAENFYDFTLRSQAANYEAIRPMFEAFGIRKPVATGIIQWMLNAAWPKMFWQLYDYYLLPGGTFYGTRKANQPVNIAYDYSNHSIYVVNDTLHSYSDLSAEIKLISIDSKEYFSQAVKVSIGENESRKVLELPDKNEATPVSFLSLKLSDSNGKPIADNFYWLSLKPDVLDFDSGDWYYTPNKEYADFSALKELEPVEIEVKQHWAKDSVTVDLKNPTGKIAFFVVLDVIGNKSGQSVVPIFWSDNYVSLLPGETKQLSAHFSPGDLHGEKPELQYSGWNLGKKSED